MDWKTIVNSDGQDGEDRESRNIMFEFESKICFIKNIVRRNSQDQVVIYLIKSDVRIRRRPFSVRGIVGLSGG
jgi:hypothetical protein